MAQDVCNAMPIAKKRIGQIVYAHILIAKMVLIPIWVYVSFSLIVSQFMTVA